MKFIQLIITIIKSNINRYQSIRFQEDIPIFQKINFFKFPLTKKNNYFAKFRRLITALFLPVSKNRTGKCIQCGACCRLPIKCPFLRKKKEGKFYCIIYAIRPPNCRKYPRSESEFLTEATCGFRFEKNGKDTNPEKHIRSRAKSPKKVY